MTSEEQKNKGKDNYFYHQKKFLFIHGTIFII